ncbi:MAG: hypothetical protein IJK53_01175 [Erysipelotrichaceae bacterium]|nr:hypothetical protein [Erysipelotrichaceae bacterium]
MKRRNNLGIEIIVILAAFICCILVLSKAFVSARVRSSQASVLSDAVTLASDCADVFLACDEKEDIAKILGGEAKGDQIIAYFDDDLDPSAQGPFKVVIDIVKQGDFETAVIEILRNEEEIYSIETGRKARS